MELFLGQGAMPQDSKANSADRKLRGELQSEESHKAKAEALLAERVKRDSR